MKNIPNTIFLNLGEDLEDFEDFNELGEVTWCTYKVGDGDIDYQRKPIQHGLKFQNLNINRYEQNAKITGIVSKISF